MRNLGKNTQIAAFCFDMVVDTGCSITVVRALQLCCEVKAVGILESSIDADAYSPMGHLLFFMPKSSVSHIYGHP